MFPLLFDSGPDGTRPANNDVQEFVAAPALAPPTATVDEKLLKEYQAEMDEAAAQPLPGENSDDDL